MPNDQWGPYKTPEDQPQRPASDIPQGQGNSHGQNPHATQYPQQPQDQQSGRGQYAPNPCGYDPYTPQQVGHPRPRVSFPTAVRLFFKNYAVFNGRASRSEFWWVVLLNILVGAVLGGINGGMGGSTTNPSTLYSVLSLVWELATLVPRIALGVRRLHDTNRSGFNLFWALLPVVGWIVLLVFYCQSSHPDAWRRYDNGTLPVEE